MWNTTGNPWANATTWYGGGGPGLWVYHSLMFESSIEFWSRPSAQILTSRFPGHGNTDTKDTILKHLRSNWYPELPGQNGFSEVYFNPKKLSYLFEGSLDWSCAKIQFSRQTPTRSVYYRFSEPSCQLLDTGHRKNSDSITPYCDNAIRCFTVNGCHISHPNNCCRQSLYCVVWGTCMCHHV